MKIRSALVGAAAALALAGGATAALAATTATAAPTYTNTLTVTAAQTHDIHISPRIQVVEFNDYTPTVAAPGFAKTSTLEAVCFAGRLPRSPVNCDWRLTSTANHHNTLDGTVRLTATGAVGKILGGTGTGHDAHGVVTVTNEAPNTSSIEFQYNVPTPEPNV